MIHSVNNYTPTRNLQPNFGISVDLGKGIKDNNNNIPETIYTALKKRRYCCIISN